MTKQIKKVGLLNEEATKKKTAPAPQKNAAETPALSSAKKTATTVEQASPVARKTGLWLLVSFALLAIIMPKPSLLQYQKLNIHTTSVYWPGVFGFGAGFTDSELDVFIDESRKELSLCFEGQDRTQCAKYQITKQGNFIDVIKHQF